MLQLRERDSWQPIVSALNELCFRFARQLDIQLIIYNGEQLSVH